MSEIFIKKFFLKKIKIKFYFDFHDLLQTFNSIAIKNLLFYCFYDHKIDFVDNFHTMRSRIYSLFYLKLMKLKKYLEKNLRKNFINFNNALFFSSILFIIKFNVIIKRNDYFIFFLDETLIKFIKGKYITKLNIIAIFNKL